jgi:allantoin racemase
MKGVQLKMSRLIRIVNVNTNQKMTKSIGEAARKCALSDTEIQAVTPRIGPASVEDYYDVYLCVPGVLEEIRRENADGYIIAGFCDPGLYAAREATAAPVIGVGEACFHMACMLGHKFSVINMLSRFNTRIEEIVKVHGLESRCASIRGTSLSVSEVTEDQIRVRKELMEAGRKAVEEDHGEVLVLGCAGLVGLDEEMEAELGVIVLDPVVTSVKMIEAIIQTGKKTSKKFTFQPLERKEMRGFSKILQP